MRRLFLTSALALVAALFGCAGGNAAAPAAPAGQSLDDLYKDVDSFAPHGIYEVYSVETGALVAQSTLDVSPDGSFSIMPRSGQDITQGPVASNGFRVAIVIDEDGAVGHVPRYTSPGGNPVFFYGDTVHYDGQITTEMPDRERLLSLVGAFEMQYTHHFADSYNLIPECAGYVGQNPLTIPVVNFPAPGAPFGTPGTPNSFPNYTWSFDGNTFSSNDMQFKLCGGAGSQPGTDLICVRIRWEFDGSLLGLDCGGLCSFICTIFDECVGIYDP